MSLPTDVSTEELLSLARDGDASAVNELLASHRGRLIQMVTIRLHPQLSARVDASDVVQETLASAARKLPDYLRDQPLAFYPWLRQIALDRLIDFQRCHLQAAKRTVRREQPLSASGSSAAQLADRLVADTGSLLMQLVHKELLKRVESALEELSDDDREILVLRHLEQTTTEETAAILCITQTAAKQRHLRAIRRLRCLLRDDVPGGTP